MDRAGIFAEFKVPELTFIGSPEKRLLRDLWSQRKLKAICKLRVSYFDFTTRTYTQFGNDFVLDFSLFLTLIIL